MKQFKTESKRILDLMINSIYTNKEIFLRELISNASDAIDKLHFISLTDEKVDDKFKIELFIDKEKRTLTIADNGIGMSEAELEKNLGTIAESGTLAFKKEQEEKSDLIGQFGVGFYSAFMVAKKIEVVSRKYGEDEAHRWVSSGASGYTIEKAEKDTNGTVITLYLRDKDDDFDYNQFLEEYFLRGLVKKYSDYIRYPIIMDLTKTRIKEKPDKAEGEQDEYETYTESTTLNGMTPVWKKSKTEVKKEEYDEFYKSKFHDFTEPRKVFHFNIEGNINYTALLYIPSAPPMDYFQKEYKKGLQLYSNGVLIMDKCEELLPDCFNFIRGVVDSSDLSLNISREMLQQDRQLRSIATSLEKKITSEMKKFMESDREGYEAFFKEFGVALKFGVYNNYGLKKEILKDLIMFHSSIENKLVTLNEYCSRMKVEQKYIYYACGDSIEKIDRLPQTELLKDKGFEILYMPDSVDEFVVKTLQKHDDKEFCSVGAKDLGFEEESAVKEKNEKTAEENKELFEFIKEALGDEVVEVRLSSRMKNNAVCLTADGEVSLEMEKVFKNLKTASAFPVIAEKVLEINPEHKIFDKIKKLYETDKDKLTSYAKLLYTTARITEGLEVENPFEFANLLNEVLSD